MNNKVSIKLLSDGAKVPVRGSAHAAGYDVYTPRDYVVMPGRNKLPLDIAMQLNPGTFAWITSRSGCALKGMPGTTLADVGNEHRYDCDVLEGKADEDYVGNYSVIVHSHETQPFLIPQGTRIAQVIIMSYQAPELVVTNELNETERGDNGFNSSGIR